ncbi:MAG: redoxin domain-containing protein [Elusimicrobiota bacterium]
MTSAFSALLLGLALLGPVPARAERPITTPAPEFPAGAAWINSEPFSLERLRGRRVVVLAFLNANSGAALRALEPVRRWWNRYALDGLMVIGVHSPDYSFARDPAWARRTYRSLDVRFPVLLDTQRRLWKDFANEGWPALYLIDEKGRVVFDRLGEGGSAEFERELLAALERFNGYRSTETVKDPPARDDCGVATRPLYLGARRGVKTVLISSRRHNALVDSRDGEVALGGEWSPEPDALRSAGPGTARLQAVYRGAEAFAVFSHAERRPLRVFVKQDNLWLHTGNAGTDVRWDGDDQSYVDVASPRMYSLVRNRRPGVHEVQLSVDDAGLAVHGLEFPDYCQTDFIRAKP